MFALRLRASRISLFYGQNGGFPAISKNLLDRFNAREPASISSQSASRFVGGGIFRFGSRGIKSLNHPLYTFVQDDISKLDEPKEENTGGAEGLQKESCSHLEDDDWSELGCVKKESFVIPKLLTEKPDQFREAKGKKKGLPCSSSAATKVTNLKGSTSKASKSSPTTKQKVKAKSNGGSRSKSEKKNETTTKNSSSSTVVEAPSSIVSVRISNLKSETADSKIHSTCTSLGSLEGLARIDQDTVKALFRVRNSKEADRILEKLNETRIDDLQWSAELQQCANPTITDVDSSQDQMGLRISSCVENMRRQMWMNTILVEDLGMLLHSLLHLENHPLSRKD
ncbi:PREDICTED: uncharacterized protein LOC104817467 [Tarenaya hassleriana]|uniref:uncharacterized protein LOC104817467 n=1 Tax=Tarenaya hassleriana TaxID=28532 RepID=UPI00053C4AC9|nr:PREDICTED: uncharacterized protein LOC104817467 [Tarenaya hassleriana]